MEDRDASKRQNISSANDNRPQAQDQNLAATQEHQSGQKSDDASDFAQWQHVGRAALSLAQLIGRRIAREHFKALQSVATNDNLPATAGIEGQDKKENEE